MLNKSILSTLFLLLIFQISNGQKKDELDFILKEAFWTNCPKEFKVKEVPEKWKNESAVIIANSFEYNIYKEYKGLKILVILKQSFHFRIKLLDKASVEEYSKLNFDNNKVTARSFGNTTSYRQVGIKIVKANGTERVLDLNKSVSTDYNSKSDNKIAVPDLEPGDIIDYFIAAKNEYDANYISYSDIVDQELLESKYPTMYRLIYYSLPTRYSIFDFAYNGSPKFTTERKGEDGIFKFVDTMRNKAPDIYWNYPYRTSPEIRYRITTDNTFDYTDIMKFKRYAYSTELAYVEDFMNKNFKKSTDTAQIINELFFMLRSPIYLNQLSSNYPLYEPMNHSGVNTDMIFFLSDYFAKKNIDHEVIIVPRRNSGPFEKQISYAYRDYVIVVKKPKPMFLSVPIPFRLPGEISYLIEGMEGAVHKHEYKLDYASAPSTIIPVSKPEDNQTFVKMNLTLNENDNLKMNIKRETFARGHNKSYHQYMIYTNYDYLKDYDKPIYEAHSSVAIGSVIAQYKKEREKFQQRATQDYIERDKKITEAIESEMDVKISDYKNLNIKSIGMWNESPNVNYTDEFTIDNLVKKVGQNYLIDFGKLIEKQLTIKDEDRIRSVDIYMNYPRSFDEEYTFTIPEGYNVEGLENFNKYAINKTGGFISSADIKEGKLVIKSRKYFNENYYPKNKWEDLLKFSDAAVDFYNTKLLLRKTE